MFYALVTDSNGNGIGSHVYAEEPGAYQANEAPCTQAQAQNPTAWQVVGGSLVQSFTAAQAAQVELVSASYTAATQQPVSFTTAGGVTKTFQADTSSQTVLMQAWGGYSAAAAVPSGFYWVASDNTQVPFTLADLKGLYAAMLGQGWAAFQMLQNLKAQILAATTVTAVQAITWP